MEDAAHSRLDPVRALVRRRIEALGLNYKAASLALGRNAAFVYQFVFKGVPRDLKEQDRIRLAELLGVSEYDLRPEAHAGADRTGAERTGADRTGADRRPEDATQRAVDLVRAVREAQAERLAPPSAPPVARAATGFRTRPDVAEVPEYDVRVSAGGGFLIEAERVKGPWPFPRTYLRELGVTPASAFVCEVQGDSMEPTLRPGDRVLGDRGDRNPGKPGVFVLWTGDGVAVKRLARIPATDPPELDILSDNPQFPSYRVRMDAIDVVGRVVWVGRRL